MKSKLEITGVASPALLIRANESMIEFYFWPTSNNRKVAIMLEEVGLEYRLMPVDIRRGDQFQTGFVALNPNSKVPAIVDLEPIISCIMRRKKIPTPLLALPTSWHASTVCWTHASRRESL